MSRKRRGNVMSGYVNESSSDEVTEDFDCDVSSSGRSARGHQEDSKSVGSNGSSETRRRGRGVSKRPCLNRNAQMARDNRQRKKEYLEKVENKLSFYRKENKNLTTRIQRQFIDLKRLNAEVTYLKNVLNNSSTITTLLKSMNDTISGKNIVKNDTKCNVINTSVKYNSNNDYKEKKKINWKNDTSAICEIGGKYIDRTKINDYGGNLKDQINDDTDHNYTTSRDSSEDYKQEYYPIIDEDSENDGNGLREMADDRFINNITKNSSCISGDELPVFDDNIFDTIDNDPDSMEYFNNDFSNDNNIFENLDNSGICLHVNSGKISLEFCSICHLNSINSNE